MIRCQLRILEVGGRPDHTGQLQVQRAAPRRARPWRGVAGAGYRVEQIKRHVFSIKHLLDQLAVLAKDDDTIDRGVSHFFMETAVNFFKCLHESSVDLRRINVRKVADEALPGLKVENLDVPDEEEQLIEEHQEST